MTVGTVEVMIFFVQSKLMTLLELMLFQMSREIFLHVQSAPEILILIIKVMVSIVK